MCRYRYIYIYIFIYLYIYILKKAPVSFSFSNKFLLLKTKRISSKQQKQTRKHVDVFIGIPSRIKPNEEYIHQTQL